MYRFLPLPFQRSETSGRRTDMWPNAKRIRLLSSWWRPSSTELDRAIRAALLIYFSFSSSISTFIRCAPPSVLALLGLETTLASLLARVGLSANERYR
jgi:hypothetical protein